MHSRTRTSHTSPRSTTQARCSPPARSVTPAGELRGLSILNVTVEEARRLKEADEAVRAGVFSVRVLPWRTPAGAMSFSRTFYPRSMRDVTD